MKNSPIPRLTDAFYAAMLEAWQAEGPAIIKRVRQEHPAAYLKLVASIFPRQIAIESEPLEFCTDHDLEALRAYLAGLQNTAGKAD